MPLGFEAEGPRSSIAQARVGEPSVSVQMLTRHRGGAIHHRAYFPLGSSMRLLTCLLLGLMLTGCSHQLPFRPHVHLPIEGCQQPVAGDQAKSTPELGNGYALHFVEFDDQGWTYPDVDRDGVRSGSPSRQMDCALADLTTKLDTGKVALYVYVHGWNHNAEHDDPDVGKFRAFLAEYSSKTRDRQVVGIYVGWQGKTWSRAGVLGNLTFWGRKNAAERVSNGRVRELFARIRGLRHHHNSSSGAACATPAHDGSDPCRFRTVMLGHSFGGLILYTAVQPYLLETLASSKDVRGAKRDDRLRAEGIADMVILLNPAFEAARHEPLHRVAIDYKANPQEAPLLVSITSLADWAVRVAFQTARQVQTAFQRPFTSDLQSESARDSIGNVSQYITHDLCVEGDGGSCSRGGGLSKRGLTSTVESRGVCKDLLLSRRADRPQGIPVWNVLTFEDVIRDHNDILGGRTLGFFEYIYGWATLGPQARQQFEGRDCPNLPLKQ